MSYEVEQVDSYAEFVASKIGCRVVYPEQNQLQLDMDTNSQFAEFERRFADLFIWGNLNTIPLVEINPSKSGLPHRHITITFADRVFNDLDRVAYQVLLGSDPVREKMNILRILKGINRPCRLFEPLEPSI